MRWLATTIASTVPCGAAPCPPFPKISISNISADAITGPVFKPTSPYF